ncbi:arginase [Schizosaccharomyces japonicus yFS275]|uniref:Arginase n=1 Tax=Schizosaccharomyces japonicus (strain yFS275 / FY16936) TaxID=402676 RepID=B6K445_SCHJY|nr:arginase [Schizosaccharomyces japonicus yFS275]EEB08252.1 arginase [Schizosaccharomyces japonicus yFS275]
MTLLNYLDHRFLGGRNVSLIKLPFGAGQKKAGVEEAPEYIMNSGVDKDLKKLGYNVEVVDVPELKKAPAEEGPSSKQLYRPLYVSTACQRAKNVIAGELSKGSAVVNIGGDHSLGIATVSAVQEVHPTSCLLWIDAHADINTPDSSPSGNLHGCPVSLVLGYAKPVPPEFEWVKTCIDSGRVAYIGLRDVDPGERMLLRQHNIPFFTMHHVDKYGIGRVVEMAMAAINPDNLRPTHLSVDVDSVDPSIVPATGTRVKGGLTFREIMYICEAVAETRTLVALDVVEVNPLLSDKEGCESTISVARSVIRTSFGLQLV